MSKHIHNEECRRGLASLRSHRDTVRTILAGMSNSAWVAGRAGDFRSQLLFQAGEVAAVALLVAIGSIIEAGAPDEDAPTEPVTVESEGRDN